MEQISKEELLGCCDVRLYNGLPLTMIMLQGWFSDQHDCFKLFLGALTHGERLYIFTEKPVLSSVKSKYKRLWDDGTFRNVSARKQGVHKVSGQLRYSWFSWWAACVSREVAKSGSLEALIHDLRTVEEAHDIFKPWFYKTKRVRNLNAADAARLLARYEYLEPEQRPLLARGALRGAAILLNDEPARKDRDKLEEEYQDSVKRVALEEKAARYIDNSPELMSIGKWRMEEGENWFCNVIHKVWYPEQQ